MDWGEELQAQISAWEQENQSSTTAAPAKRPASGSTDLPDRGTKRAKTAYAERAISDEAVKETFDKNEIGKVSNPPIRNMSGHVG